MQKTRPCVIISPNEMNLYIRTVIIAPMTTKSHKYPSRIPVHFAGKEGEIVLDQLRTVDKARLIKHLGKIGEDAAKEVCNVLAEMFEY